MDYLILANGFGSRFAKVGFDKPKPFIELDGKPLYQHVIDNYQLPEDSVTLLVRGSHSEFVPGHLKTVTLPPTRGPAETLKLALDQTHPLGAFAVLDCDCWLELNLPDLMARITTEDRYMARDALVLSVPHATKYDHFTDFRYMPDSTRSNYSKKFAPPLIDFGHGPAEGHVNPGLYIFQGRKAALELMNQYLASQPRVEPTLPRALSYHHQMSRTGVIEKMARFTSVGTPEEYQDYLCTRS